MPAMHTIGVNDAPSFRFPGSATPTFHTTAAAYVSLPTAWAKPTSVAKVDIIQLPRYCSHIELRAHIAAANNATALSLIYGFNQNALGKWLPSALYELTWTAGNIDTSATTWMATTNSKACDTVALTTNHITEEVDSHVIGAGIADTSMATFLFPRWGADLIGLYYKQGSSTEKIAIEYALHGVSGTKEV